MPSMVRPNSPYLDSILGEQFPVLDAGFIRVVDYAGNDDSIVQMARVSYGEGTKTPSDDRGLIRYLMRNRHTSPFEGCEIKLHVKLPIFVARQWIRTRTASVNELSARYSEIKDEFYIPEAADIRAQSEVNKQGRGGELDPEAVHWFDRMCRNNQRQFTDYKMVLKDGVARELARINLPLSTYTEWYWKIDLHNLLHFLSLRCDPHAQMEIRVYADIIADIVKGWVPYTYEAFRDYRLEARTFSRMELDILADMVQGLGWAVESRAEGKMSKREIVEFVAKLSMEEKSE